MTEDIKIKEPSIFRLHPEKDAYLIVGEGWELHIDRELLIVNPISPINGFITIIEELAKIARQGIKNDN